MFKNLIKKINRKRLIKKINFKLDYIVQKTLEYRAIDPYCDHLAKCSKDDKNNISQYLIYCNHNCKIIETYRKSDSLNGWKSLSFYIGNIEAYNFFEDINGYSIEINVTFQQLCDCLENCYLDAQMLEGEILSYKKHIVNQSLGIA